MKPFPAFATNVNWTDFPGLTSCVACFSGQGRGLLLEFFLGLHTGSSFATNTVVLKLQDQEWDPFYGKEQRLRIRQSWVQIPTSLYDLRDASKLLWESVSSSAKWE